MLKTMLTLPSLGLVLACGSHSASTRDVRIPIDVTQPCRVQELEQVIQQSSASTEQVATTTSQLAGQAEQLLTTAAFFKLQGRDISTETAGKAELAPKTSMVPKMVLRSHPVHNKSVMAGHRKSVILQKGEQGVDLQMADGAGVSDNDFIHPKKDNGGR